MNNDEKQPESKEPEVSEASGFAAFWTELKRRKVMRVAITYAVVAWLIIQVASTTFGSFGIPEWAFRFVVVMLCIFFPVAIILAWAFELTPDGIKTTKAARKEQGDVSVSNSQQRGRNWMAFAFAAGLPTLIFGAFAIFFYLRSGTLEAELSTIHPVAADQRGDGSSLSTSFNKSIAVLPFDNRSNLDEDQFFTDGIHDDLLTQISRIRDIKTISRTSVMGYKDTTKNMRQIGEELGVSTLLEGGVQRAGNQIRINMQLIDASTDAHLWAETYTRKMTAENVFIIQTEIAEAIADALKAVLSPEEQKRIEKLPTQNMEALEAFFRGRTHYILNTSEGYSEAIVHFQSAVALDSEFAEAYTQLALATLEKIFYGGYPVEQQTALAQPLVDRALALDPGLSEAHQALGYLRRYQERLVEAVSAFDRAIELNPNNASAYAMYGSMKTWIDVDPVLSIELVQKAVQLDPQSTHAKSQLAEAFANAGRFVEARAVLEESIAIEPDFAQSYVTLGLLLGRSLFQFDDAMIALRKAHALDPQNPATMRELGAFYDELNMTEEAIFWIERSNAISPGGEGALNHLAYLHALRGNKKEELALRKSWPANRSSWSLYNLYDLVRLEVENGNPEAARIRCEKIFPELIRRGVKLDQFPKEFIYTYAYALLACGENELAQPFLDHYLSIRDSTHRLTWKGVGLSDLDLFLQLNDLPSALAALKEWRALGGRKYFSWSDVPEDAQLDPEFKEINDQMLAEIAAQRANLEAMEANGELEPIPPLPEAGNGEE